MSTNITAIDLENVRLSAETKYSKFRRRFKERMEAPNKAIRDKIVFNSLSDEAKEKWKNADPEAYAAAEKMYGGG